MNASISDPVELTVVIPVYNERARLPPTLDQVRAHLDGGTDRWELIVVDDGSTDGSAQPVRAAARRDPRVRLLCTPANRGKGHAVRTGVLASRGRLVLVTDLCLFARRGWPVAEIPVRWTHRAGSKIRPVDYAKVLGEVVLVRLRHGRVPA